jgi:hypothetical protein
MVQDRYLHPVDHNSRLLGGRAPHHQFTARQSRPSHAWQVFQGLAAIALRSRNLAQLRRGKLSFPGCLARRSNDHGLVGIARQRGWFGYARKHRQPEDAQPRSHRDGTPNDKATSPLPLPLLKR